MYLFVHSLTPKSKEKHYLRLFDQFGSQTEDKGASCALSSCLGLRSFTWVNSLVLALESALITPFSSFWILSQRLSALFLAVMYLSL